MTGFGKIEQPHHIGDMAAALADAPRQVFLRVAEIVHQPAISVGFLEWRKILPLKVLHQRNFKSLAVIELLDDDRHFVELRFLRGPPPAFAGDDLEYVAFVSVPPNQNGLEDTLFSDGTGEIVQVFFVHAMARLKWTWSKQIDFNGLVGAQAVEFCVILVFLRTEQRRQPPAQVGALRLRRHQATASRSRRKTSPARWRYARDPAQLMSYMRTGRPWDGASDTRTLRGITVL